MCVRFEANEFCHLCARYINDENDRIEITDAIEEMYLDIYDEEMGLSVDSPESICKGCFESLESFVMGEIDLIRVQKPAIWGECKPDHRDCFYHLVIVDFDKNITTLPKKAAYYPPKFASTKKDELV